MLDALAVESEPGLSTAQLMLVNHDLKPGALLLILHIRINIRRLHNFSRAGASSMECLEFCRVLGSR